MGKVLTWRCNGDERAGRVEYPPRTLYSSGAVVSVDKRYFDTIHEKGSRARSAVYDTKARLHSAAPFSIFIRATASPIMIEPAVWHQVYKHHQRGSSRVSHRCHGTSVTA